MKVANPIRLFPAYIALELVPQCLEDFSRARLCEEVCKVKFSPFRKDFNLRIGTGYMPPPGNRLSNRCRLTDRQTGSVPVDLLVYRYIQPISIPQ